MSRWTDGFFAPGCVLGPGHWPGHSCLPRPDRTQRCLVATPAHGPAAGHLPALPRPLRVPIAASVFRLVEAGCQPQFLTS